jgi:hypothetical protein
LCELLAKNCAIFCEDAVTFTTTPIMSMNIERYQFIADALAGSGGFSPVVVRDADGKAQSVRVSNLVPYPRESEIKFARRNEVAWYENHLLPACQRFVGYLAKKPPVRDLPHPLLEAFALDCNWRGDAMDVFWQGFMLQARARGCMLLLIDMPRTLPDNAADQKTERAFPYLVPIVPERVVSWAVDFRGRLTKLEYGDVLDDGTAAIRGWNIERWWVRKGDQQIDGDEHTLGVCPALYFSESGEFPFFGPFAQIADLSKRLFNARSELDEILRSQTFSLLTYQNPPETAHNFNASQVAEAIGTHNMLVHGGATPAFIAPPDGPARTYLETIAHIEKAIARIALAIETPEQQSAESGLALTIRFQSLNAALTGFARRMEDLERGMWEMVSRWMNLDGVASTDWSKDYALADLANELQTLADMIASGMPDSIVRQQKKSITSIAFPTLPSDEMQVLLDAIDESSQEIVTVEDEQKMQGFQISAEHAYQAPAPVIDLTPIAEAIASIKPPVVNVDVAAPVINIPEQAAPVVTVEGSTINVSPPAVTVTIPEAPPAAAPSVTLNTGTGGRVINLVRDESGSISGATVSEK